MPLTAPYMGERVHNPMVSGGDFDTVGNKELPPLPKGGDDESYHEFKSRVKSPEYQEVRRARDAAKRENAAKRERARLIRAGANINMRRDRLPGDPKIMG